VTRRRADHFLPIALAALALAGFLTIRDSGLMINDEGWILHPVLRMQEGDVLYRDLWTFYAPLRYHVFQLLFSTAEPSLHLVRNVWIACLVASVAGLYPLARRLAPLSLAWIPSFVYALAPGPWHKAPYGLCTVGFFLALARFLERPRGRRLALLGAVGGVTLLTRQDLGIAQLLLASAAAGITAALARGPHAGRIALRRVAVVIGCFALTAAPLLAYYAYQGALASLVDAVFVRAFAQMGAHQPLFSRFFAPEAFASAPEGRAVGVILLVPVVVYFTAGAVLLRRLWQRREIDATWLLPGFLLVYGIGTLPQVYFPLLLLRLLQSALPFYLLAVWLLARAMVALSSRGRGSRQIGAALPGLAAATGVAFLWWIVAGLPRFVPFDEYSGSWRARRYAHPVRVLGDEVLVDWQRAEEIRLVRAFVAQHTSPGEPVFAAPLFSLYYVLVDRPNPTRMLAEHMREGDYVLVEDQKRREMERLLASNTRYAIVDRDWLAMSQPPGPIRRPLVESFPPVRLYGRVAVLDRDESPRAREVIPIYRRMTRRQSRPEDLARLRALARDLPHAPLPRELLGDALAAQGDLDGAVGAWQAAFALDSANARLLERAAEARLEQGRPVAAATNLKRALAVRESPTLRRLAGRLGPVGRWILRGGGDVPGAASEEVGSP
jgi:hypothetical protein